MALRNKPIQVLSEEYVIDLLRTCCEDPDMMEVAAMHLKEGYLPDRDSISVFRSMKRAFNRERCKISQSVLIQDLMGNRSGQEFARELFHGERLSNQTLLSTLEEFIKSVELKRTLQEVNAAYNKDPEKAIEMFITHAEWQRDFTLKPSGFRDPINEFVSHYDKIKEKMAIPEKIRRPVTRFYIDELDVRNDGQDLRTNLTCFMASTGVGKSHVLRHIGRNACYMDGLDVLHLQLEGSEDETLEYYAAAMAECNVRKYRRAGFLEAEFTRLKDKVSKAAGTLKIKVVEKLGVRYSTRDIRNAIAEYKKEFKRKPDVIVIDSMDLINDTPILRGKEEERFIRVAVSQELKNIANEEDVWMVVSYQSTINDPQWVNDEKNVLTEYNCAEAKGIARALDQLITLNCSTREREEGTMRIYPAKCRHFPNSGIIKIATRFSHEVFYDRARTMQLIDNAA